MSFKGLYNVNKTRMIALLCLEVLTSALSIGVSYINTYQITALKERKLQQFFILISLSLSLLVLNYIDLNICQYWIEAQIQQYNHQIRIKLVSHYFNDGKNYNSASIQNRLTNDLNLINESKLLVYTDIPYYLTQIIFASIGLLFFNWSLLVIVLTVGILNFYLPKLLHSSLQKAALKLSQANKNYLNTAEKWLTGLSELQKFSAGSQLFKVMNHASNKLEDANIARTKTIQSLIILNKGLASLLQLFLLGVTAFLVTQNIVLFGVIVTVESFSLYINTAIKMLTTELGQIHSVDKLNTEIQNATSSITQFINLKSPVSLSTNNLSIKFSGGKIIKLPDLDIKAGEKILLTGDSGSGKTTLFKIILGKIKPNTGTISFRNKNRQKIDQNEAKIGYIPQDPILFPDSIKNNITMFDASLNNKVATYINKFSFKNDIQKMPLKLETKLEVQNLNISGGQRQKIILSRACIHNDTFLLIDEGTSAIDQKATLEILQELIRTPITIIFIAHNFNQDMNKLFDREIHLSSEQ